MNDVHWVELGDLDRAPNYNFEVDFEDWRMRARRDKLRPTLARKAADEARQAGARAVGVRAGVAALEFSREEALENVRSFAAEAHAAGLTLMVQVGGYNLSAPRAEGLPTRVSPAIDPGGVAANGADEVIVFSPASAVPGTADDALRAEADRIDGELRARHLMDRQVYTVLDTRYALDASENEWQEDADWMTGLYCAAMCFAHDATGDPGYADRAREVCLALIELNDVSGVPGVVARQIRRERPVDVKEGRKRWIASPNGRDWWSSDTSRDQLSGHFFGLAVYHDLLANDEERDSIRRVIGETLGRVIDGDMWMRDPDGGPCTYANFFVSTLFGLSAFKVAYHITGEQRFQDKYLELIDPHFFLGHAMKDCWRQQDAFFQHYQQDSPIYHLLMYETDPRLKRAYARCLRGLHNESLANGNVYHLIGHAAFQPEAAKGPAASRELTQFSETQLSMPVWHGRVEKALSADDADLPDSVRRTLEALLSGDRTSLDPDELYIPIEWRPPMEFGWQYDRHALSPGHGPHTRYSGVDYLIAFWMGRYHGVV